MAKDRLVVGGTSKDEGLNSGSADVVEVPAASSGMPAMDQLSLIHQPRDKQSLSKMSKANPDNQALEMQSDGQANLPNQAWNIPQQKKLGRNASIYDEQGIAVPLSAIQSSCRQEEAMENNEAIGTQDHDGEEKMLRTAGSAVRRHVGVSAQMEAELHTPK